MFQPVASPSAHPLMSARLTRSEEHTSELQSQSNLVCRLLLEKKKAQAFSAFARIAGRDAGPEIRFLTRYRRPWIGGKVRRQARETALLDAVDKSDASDDRAAHAQNQQERAAAGDPPDPGSPGSRRSLTLSRFSRRGRHPLAPVPAPHAVGRDAADLRRRFAHKLAGTAKPGLPPPHGTTATTAATARMVVSLVGAGPRGSVPIRKGKDIVRTRLPFRYHPPSVKQGPTLTLRELERVPSEARPARARRRTALAVRFVLSGWRNKAALNLAEVLTHTV